MVGRSRHSRQEAERIGRAAERLGAVYLQLKGYKILERRFKSRSGEIDIIARKGSVIAVIEVKRRATLAQCHDSLTHTGLKRIEAACDDYMAKNTLAQTLDIRFDALFVTGRIKVTHLKDAWRLY